MRDSGCERAAGLDLGELAGIADQHDLGAGCLGVGEDSVEFAGADHGGLVDHDHVAVGQCQRAVELPEQPVDRERWDTGGVLQSLCRLGGQARADDAVAGRRPGFVRGLQRGCLARAGDAFDDLHSRAGAAHRSHHAGLLQRERWTVKQRGIDVRGGRDAGLLVATQAAARANRWRSVATISGVV